MEGSWVVQWRTLNFGGDLGILTWVNEQKNTIIVVAYPDRGAGNDPKLFYLFIYFFLGGGGVVFHHQGSIFLQWAIWEQWSASAKEVCALWVLLVISEICSNGFFTALFTCDGNESSKHPIDQVPDVVPPPSPPIPAGVIVCKYSQLHIQYERIYITGLWEWLMKILMRNVIMCSSPPPPPPPPHNIFNHQG